MTQTILIADDDDSVLTVLTQAVRRRGYRTRVARDGAELMAMVETGEGAALITDVLMPFSGKEASSFAWLPSIRARRPELPVIVISAQNTLSTAVKASECGAYEYLPKPFDLNRLLDCLEHALALPIAEEVPVLPAVREQAALIGASAAMQAVYKTLARVVRVDLTVMITGESGTGKELIARSLHELGHRAKKPFVAVNMAAIPKELVESELFGHEKGAFTGAHAKKAGKFALASGGTLFLDEIGDMPLDAQTKLLRVLQEGEFTPVGAEKPVKADVRIVCATHRDLRQSMQAGEFREDLYYRLNVVPIRMPALRERKEDIPALARHFLYKGARAGLPEKHLTEEALELLQAQEWPGNIRELENCIYRACTLGVSRMIGAEELQRHFTQASVKAAQEPSGITSLEQLAAEQLKAYFGAHEGALPPEGLYARILPLIERPLIAQALAATRGNQIRAAQLLGINRNTLRKRMQELGIRR